MTDQTMIERLCRAACLAGGGEPDRMLGTRQEIESGAARPEWACDEPEVRAVLEALKEPSKEMQDAGNEIIASESWPHAKDVFYFMIQAILDEAER